MILLLVRLYNYLKVEKIFNILNSNAKVAAKIMKNIMCYIPPVWMISSIPVISLLSEYLRGMNENAIGAAPLEMDDDTVIANIALDCNCGSRILPIMNTNSAVIVKILTVRVGDILRMLDCVREAAEWLELDNDSIVKRIMNVDINNLDAVMPILRISTQVAIKVIATLCANGEDSEEMAIVIFELMGGKMGRIIKNNALMSYGKILQKSEFLESDSTDFHDPSQPTWRLHGENLSPSNSANDGDASEVKGGEFGKTQIEKKKPVFFSGWFRIVVAVGYVGALLGIGIILAVGWSQ
ncbi:MAG: hypothetical protein LBI69_02570 [Puniceicoccales bacterium]|jgi:hypothetical protein|nr:hypothetical protein [Puniceicoccales bacterium]